MIDKLHGRGDAAGPDGRIPPSPAPYPLFLRLTGCPCLVVGAGNIAASKIPALLASGARVRVVAPRISSRVRGLAEAARNGPATASLELVPRCFEEADLDGVFLVIAATDDAALNRRVFELTSARRVPVNVVDRPPLCTFIAPAVVRRGDLQIAISTNGESPLLAAWIRHHLETIFSPDWERYVRWLGAARRRVHDRTHIPTAERVGELRALSVASNLELLLRGEEAEFKQRMEQWSASLPD